MNTEKSYTDVLFRNLKKFTRLDDEAIHALVRDIPVTTARKGEVLLRQGDEPGHSFYLMKGCVRQYACDAQGKEATVNFFVEEEPINMFSFADAAGASLYSLSCLEDCALVECADTDPENAQPDAAIDGMKQQMFAKQYTDMQKHYASFRLLSSEERLQQLIAQRPELLDRVPQVYLASYLGITPEAFSRIKKRLQAGG
mgnify:CR=1 FL=1